MMRLSSIHHCHVRWYPPAREIEARDNPRHSDVRKVVFLLLVATLIAALVWVVFRSRLRGEFAEYERNRPAM